MVDIDSAKRRRYFVRSVTAVNLEERYGRIDPDEAWAVFKGLLGRSDIPEMKEGLRAVYGDQALIRGTSPETRLHILRTAARRFMKTVKRRDYMIRRPPVPQQQAPPPPVQPPPAPAAPAINQEDQQRIRNIQAAINQHVAFDMFRMEIERTGRIETPFPDNMPLEHIEELFAMMRNCGECPICLDNVPRLYPWTYQCGHKACMTCMQRLLDNTMMLANFPVMCPGGCGHSIDPRLVLDVFSESRGGSLVAKELIIRFVALQLGSTVKMAPSTAMETNACPNCRTIIFGRCFEDKPMARCTNPFCACRFCVSCKTPWHEGLPCLDRAKMDSESTDFISKTSKACPRCSRRTEHFRNHRCHHITCICTYQYCYECLEPWTEHGVGKLRESCPLFCSENCHCTLCDKCKPGKPCNLCYNGCPSCKNVI